MLSPAAMSASVAKLFSVDDPDDCSRMLQFILLANHDDGALSLVGPVSGSRHGVDIRCQDVPRLRDLGTTHHRLPCAGDFHCGPKAS